MSIVECESLKKIYLRQTRRAVAYAAAPSPTAEAGLVGSVYLGVAPIVKSVDKNVVVAADAAAAPATVASAPVAAVQANASSSNSATTVGKRSSPRNDPVIVFIVGMTVLANDPSPFQPKVQIRSR